MAINDKSGVFGIYTSSNDRETHFYIRDKKGHAKAFDVPGANPSSLNPVAINSAGYAVGTAQTDSDISFERTPDGTLEFINPSDSAIDVFVTGLTEDGATVGGYENSDASIHGFCVTVDGKATTIDYPKTTTFTEVSGINASKVMVGQFADKNGVVHGFLRTP